MATYRFPKDEAPLLTPVLSPILNRLLFHRNVTDLEAFLSPDYDSQLHDPRLLHDMDGAVSRIQEAIQKSETICIFSDYDCDGIPGAVVLYDYFKAISYEHFINYIPHRHYEGFGLSSAAIDTLHNQGVSLIITIDCGTSDGEAISYAKEKGISVIVTDHHEPPAVLPEATAIVNPKIGSYPFTELCGAAVAFKLAQALLLADRRGVPIGHEKWWLDMVGIATIADLVPLVGENRVLAHYGLQVLRKSRRPGLQKLLQKNKIDQRFLTEEDIGFTIGPRINAASRMDTPEIAFQMLAEKDPVKAAQLVDQLEKLNQERKVSVAQMTKELNKRLEHLEDMPPVLVMGNPEWRPSLVGLAANKLAETYNRPVFLWGKDGNGVFKGSCRSGGGVSVVTLMNEVSDIFIEHGGHHASGGFSVRDEHIFTLSDSLNQAARTLGDAVTFEEEVVVDEVLSLDHVTDALLSDIALLAPYGKGNHKPLFAFAAVSPRKIEQFGKNKEHLKVVFECTSGPLEAIAFFATPDQFQRKVSDDTTVTIIGHIEQSYFMNKKQRRIRIVDII